MELAPRKFTADYLSKEERAEMEKGRRRILLQGYGLGLGLVEVTTWGLDIFPDNDILMTDEGLVLVE